MTGSDSVMKAGVAKRVELTNLDSSRQWGPREDRP